MSVFHSCHLLSDHSQIALTFQVPMPYCSLLHQTLLPSPVTSTTGCCFCLVSVSLFFLELFLHWSPVAYWAPTDLGSSSFSILYFCLFIPFMGFSRQGYWSGLSFPSPVGHILSELSTMTPLSWVAPHGMADSFIELEDVVVHVIRVVSFLWLWFSVCLPSDGEGLWKLPEGIDWLRAILGLLLMGGAMLSKSFTHFSVDEWSYVPSLLFTCGQTMAKVMKMMMTSLRRYHACTAMVHTPNPAAVTTNPRLCWRLLDAHRRVSCGVTVPFSWALVHKVLLCPPGVYPPILCKFWQLCGGVNDGLLQEELAIPTPRAPVPAADHCQPVPPQETLKHSSLSVSARSLGLVHTRFVWAPWVSLVGVGFHSKCEFTPSYHLAGASLLPLDMGYLLTATPVPPVLLGFLWPWTWGISTPPVQRRTAVAPNLVCGLSIHCCSSEAEVPLLTLDVIKIDKNLKCY